MLLMKYKIYQMKDELCFNFFKSAIWLRRHGDRKPESNGPTLAGVISIAYNLFCSTFHCHYLPLLSSFNQFLELPGLPYGMRTHKKKGKTCVFPTKVAIFDSNMNMIRFWIISCLCLSSNLYQNVPKWVEL